MGQQIEALPSQKLLAKCQRLWELSDITFVRKMENIVYRCQRQGQTVYLRLTTPLRRSKREIAAELHFISHLADAGMRVPHVVRNNQDQTQITLTDDNHSYEVVVFTEVTGQHPPEALVQTSEYLNNLGALIAKMHLISEQYESSSPREHWHEERGIRHALQALKTSDDREMKLKFEQAVAWLKSLEKTPSTYGLIHADMGALNLFVNEEGELGVIDFDDSCNHFFVFDLAIVLYSMANRFSNAKNAPIEKKWCSDLVTGYRTQRALSDTAMNHITKLMDFACLRVYFWIEDHEQLNTFHESEIQKINKMKQWARSRII